MENPATWSDLERVIADVLDGEEPTGQVAGAVLAVVASHPTLKKDYAPPSREYVAMTIQRFRDQRHVIGLSLVKSVANLFVRRRDAND